MHTKGNCTVKNKKQKKYRAGVIGLGWMGFLYDLGKRDYERIGGSHENLCRLSPDGKVSADERR